MTEKVGLRAIKSGDVIEFYDYVGNKNKTPSSMFGVVYDVEKKDGNIISYGVLPLTAHAGDEYVKNDEQHVMFGRSSEKELDDAGLDSTKNYRVKFQILTVNIADEHHRKNSKGGVLKYGSFAETQVFDTILNRSEHAAKHRLNLRGGLTTQQTRDLIGRRDSTLDIIDLRAARARPAPDSVIEHVVTVPPKSGKSKIKRPRKHDKTATRINLNLEDAAALGLISKEISDLLQKNKGRRKGLTTLHEAYLSAAKTPEKLKARVPNTKEPKTLQDVLKVASHDDIKSYIEQTVTRSHQTFILRQIQDTIDKGDTKKPFDETDIYENTESTLRKAVMALNPAAGIEDHIVQDVKQAWAQFMQDVMDSTVDTDSRYEGIQTRYPVLDI